MGCYACPPVVHIPDHRRRIGLKVALADVSVQGLERVAREVKAIAGDINVLVVPTDVSDLAQVQALRDRVLDTWGEVGWISQ